MSLVALRAPQRRLTMRHFKMMRAVMIVTAVCAAAACSGGGSGATTPTDPPPPKDTTTKVTPPPAVLDSLRLGVYDQNNVLHLYPDTVAEGLPHLGSLGSIPFAGVIAFTSVGPITDPSSIQALFGAMTLSSDNPAVISPGGSCGGPGWPCMTLMGVLGSAHITFSVGGKSLTEVVTVVVQ
jgi:hypothetical protein